MSNASSNRRKRNRTLTLTLSLSIPEREQLVRAAALTGDTLGAFVRAAAIEEAQRILNDEATYQREQH